MQSWNWPKHLKKKKTLLALSVMFCLSCESAPKGLTCISDPSVNGLECFDSRDNKSKYLRYDESDNFVCRPAEFDKELALYYQSRCKDEKATGGDN